MENEVGGGAQNGGYTCMPIYVYVLQKPSQYCKVIILQLKNNKLIFLKRRNYNRKKKSLHLGNN